MEHALYGHRSKEGTTLLLGLASMLAVAPAWAQTPQPTPARANGSEPRPHDRSIRAVFAHVPSDTAASIVIPKPGLFFQKVRAEAGHWKQRSLLRFAAVELALDETFGLRLDARSLGRIGIAAKRPWVVLPGTDDEPWVVRVSVSDRRRFEAFLARTAGAERTSVSIGRERAMVLFPESDWPLTCLVRLDHAFCQIGAARDRDPIATLKPLILGKWTALNENAELAKGLDALEPGLDVYAVVQPKRFARSVERFWTQRRRRADRFRGKKKRHRARGAHETGRQLSAVFTSAKSAAIGIGIGRPKMLAQVELNLEPSAARWLRERIDVTPGAHAIRDWSETPALAQFIVRLKPEALAEALSTMGLPVPDAALDGTLAAMALGIDGQCRAAKAGPRDPTAYLFALPFAAAAGLRQPVSQDALQALERSGFFADIDRGADRAVHVLHGKHLDSPFELRVHPDVLLVGTGPGVGAAAERRWQAKKRVAGEPAVFALRLDLPAIDAAFGAARFDGHTRKELVRLEALRQRMEPLMSRFQTIDLSAHSGRNARRVRVRLAFSHRH